MKRIIRWTLAAIAAIQYTLGFAQKSPSGSPDPDKFYEIRTSGGLALDNNGRLEPGSGIFTSRGQEGRESQVWQIKTHGT